MTDMKLFNVDQRHPGITFDDLRVGIVKVREVRTRWRILGAGLSAVAAASV
jgi:hypothetical protein